MTPPVSARTAVADVPSAVPAVAGHVDLESHQDRTDLRGRSLSTVLMTTDAVGGVWRYTIDLARGLRDRGVQTTVAVMGPAPSAAQRREAESLGVHLVDRPFRLEWMEDPWADVKRAGDWLLALERTVRPQIVHLNGYSHAALPWSVPVVVVAHSCVRTWWKAVKGEPAPPWLAQYTHEVAAGLAAACMVIAPTAAMLDSLAAEYGRPRQSRVIPNGCGAIDSGEPPLGSKEPLIFSAGRVWDDAKNISALSAVAAELTWPVYVAGECRQPGKSQAELHAVHLVGCLAQADLAQWYRRASIYALPARYEPFGLSVLEAASAGCALVLGDIGSLRENWADAALFVPADDHAALGSAIQHLIDDPETRMDLTRRAFARASSFTLNRTTEEYLRVYEGLI
jgi:glycogen synthase